MRWGEAAGAGGEAAGGGQGLESAVEASAALDRVPCWRVLWETWEDCAGLCTSPRGPTRSVRVPPSLLAALARMSLRRSAAPGCFQGLLWEGWEGLRGVEKAANKGVEARELAGVWKAGVGDRGVPATGVLLTDFQGEAASASDQAES